MTTALLTPETAPEPTMSVPSLDRYTAWDLLRFVADERPLCIDVDGSPLLITVAHTREVEPSNSGFPGVQLLPVGMESNQAETLVSGTLSVTYGDVHREFSWKPGFVSDARWDVAEFIEGLVS